MTLEEFGAGKPEKFYYNMKTKQVETGKESASNDRVGPFDTREDAENAPETFANRAAEWAAEEEAEDA